MTTTVTLGEFGHNLMTLHLLLKIPSGRNHLRARCRSRDVNNVDTPHVPWSLRYRGQLTNLQSAATNSGHSRLFSCLVSLVAYL
jgi:hypothetical protein